MRAQRPTPPGCDCTLDVMSAHAPDTVLQRARHFPSAIFELIPTILGKFEPLR